ncbi:MAG: hypothetical protein JW955_00665 [Sedimentisphaerales bacterium]|nr:hypothetical protein [Sedimentisphaerales bacterium]
MSGSTWVRTFLFSTITLGLSASMAAGANILFISAMDPVMQPGDDALKAFMEGLGHTVTYLDDDVAEKETEEAAAAADLVFISESVGSAKVRLEITEIETPMVIAEAWAYDEMGLTHGTGEGLAVASTDIEIVMPGHPLAGGLTGTVSVLTALESSRGAARFATGAAGDQATVVARATLSDGVTYDVLWVYEKGAQLAVPPADGSLQKAADIRICLGFDELSYLAWNENAYKLLEAAINFGLGIRNQPQAYAPSPADGQTEVPRETGLSWRPGSFANTHDVYFGTDFNDVNEAGADDPRGVLVSEGQDANDLRYRCRCLYDFGQTYYWRVDEVNGPPDFAVVKGNVWSFTILNFLLIDDFERYSDEEPNRVFDTWKDGWDVEGNGSVVGHPDPNWEADEHYVETVITHGGEQSMPFSYDNDKRYSEARLALPESMRDWTQEGIVSLSLWFQGYPRYVGGFVQKAGGVYEVTGAGTDIWATADQFHFAFKEVSGGSCMITVKVESLENVNKDSKAGVMIRDSLDAGSPNTALLLTPDPTKGLRFQNRATSGGDTVRGTTDLDPNAMPPYWLKLERTSGGLIRASRSADGAQWKQFDLKTQAMKMPIYIGLAVTSHSSGVPCKGVFSNVTVTGTGTDKPWADQDVGLITNTPEPMYVVLNDSAFVYHPDPNAVTTDLWSQWVIPLQAFADRGVDLTNVDTVGIGVGTRGNTTDVGGQGQMYFDDIRLYRP